MGNALGADVTAGVVRLVSVATGTVTESRNCVATAGNTTVHVRPTSPVDDTAFSHSLARAKRNDTAGDALPANGTGAACVTAYSSLGAELGTTFLDAGSLCTAAGTLPPSAAPSAVAENPADCTLAAAAAAAANAASTTPAAVVEVATSAAHTVTGTNVAAEEGSASPTVEHSQLERQRLFVQKLRQFRPNIEVKRLAHLVPCFSAQSEDTSGSSNIRRSIYCNCCGRMQQERVVYFLLLEWRDMKRIINFGLPYLEIGCHLALTGSGCFELQALLQQQLLLYVQGWSNQSDICFDVPSPSSSLLQDPQDALTGTTAAAVAAPSVPASPSIAASAIEATNLQEQLRYSAAAREIEDTECLVGDAATTVTQSTTSYEATAAPDHRKAGATCDSSNRSEAESSFLANTTVASRAVDAVAVSVHLPATHSWPSKSVTSPSTAAAPAIAAAADGVQPNPISALPPLPAAVAADDFRQDDSEGVDLWKDTPLERRRLQSAHFIVSFARESVCIIEALDFLMHYFPSTIFRYEGTRRAMNEAPSNRQETENFYECSLNSEERQEFYPYLLVNLKAGVSFHKVIAASCSARQSLSHCLNKHDCNNCSKSKNSQDGSNGNKDTNVSNSNNSGESSEKNTTSASDAEHNLEVTADAPMRGCVSQRIGGSTIGGATFMGLCRLLLDDDDVSPRELLKLAVNGDSRVCDMLVRDIYGGGYEAIGVKASTIASTFGKLQYTPLRLLEGYAIAKVSRTAPRRCRRGQEWSCCFHPCDSSRVCAAARRRLPAVCCKKHTATPSCQVANTEDTAGQPCFRILARARICGKKRWCCSCFKCSCSSNRTESSDLSTNSSHVCNVSLLKNREVAAAHTSEVSHCCTYFAKKRATSLCCCVGRLAANCRRSKYQLTKCTHHADSDCYLESVTQKGDAAGHSCCHHNSCCGLFRYCHCCCLCHSSNEGEKMGSSGVESRCRRRCSSETAYFCSQREHFTNSGALVQASVEREKKNKRLIAAACGTAAHDTKSIDCSDFEKRGDFLIEEAHSCGGDGFLSHAQQPKCSSTHLSYLRTCNCCCTTTFGSTCCGGMCCRRLSIGSGSSVSSEWRCGSEWQHDDSSSTSSDEEDSGMDEGSGDEEDDLWPARGTLVSKVMGEDLCENAGSDSIAEERSTALARKLPYKRPEGPDIVRSLLTMMSFNVAQQAYLHAALHGLKRIALSGFLLDVPGFLASLQHSVRFWSKNECKVFFCSVSAFLGALGACVSHERCSFAIGAAGGLRNCHEKETEFPAESYHAAISKRTDVRKLGEITTTNQANSSVGAASSPKSYGDDADLDHFVGLHRQAVPLPRLREKESTPKLKEWFSLQNDRCATGLLPRKSSCCGTAATNSFPLDKQQQQKHSVPLFTPSTPTAFVPVSQYALPLQTAQDTRDMPSHALYAAHEFVDEPNSAKSGDVDYWPSFRSHELECIFPPNVDVHNGERANSSCIACTCECGLSENHKHSDASWGPCATVVDIGDNIRYTRSRVMSPSHPTHLLLPEPLLPPPPPFDPSTGKYSQSMPHCRSRSFSFESLGPRPSTDEDMGRNIIEQTEVLSPFLGQHDVFSRAADIRKV